MKYNFIILIISILYLESCIDRNNTNFKTMFDILEKAPNFIFAGVEFSGNEISRNLGASKTRKLIEKYIY